MGKVTGFMDYARELPERRPVAERVNDWFEVYQDFPNEKVQTQAARCMDCGVPFCHTGCPLNNIIPDWNDLVYRDRWREAVRVLHATNNFPEFTGRICPAPCEAACVLGINDAAGDHQSDRAHHHRSRLRPGMDSTRASQAHRTGKRVAIVGSGPAGLAAAQQLARAGHWVTVFEKADRIGGLLRYGIPDFKMEKRWIDRRLAQMSGEGGRACGPECAYWHSDSGHGSPAAIFRRLYWPCGRQEHPRDLNVPGRELKRYRVRHGFSAATE